MEGLKMELGLITSAMRHYNNEVARGSESWAWIDYVQSVFAKYRVHPDQLSNEKVTDRVFTHYWLDVANRENTDYLSETGNRVN
jgi:hypothetical protein